MWIPVKKKKQKEREREREKKKVHTAGGGRERADGLCGSGVVQACRRVGTWMRMAVNKKEKRRTKPEGLSMWMGVWACGRVGVWACGRADGCAAVWACGCGWL